jgi:hypothetical protein
MVARRMHLDFTDEEVTHCAPISQGTVGWGWHIMCKMGADLTVADDFSVTSSGHDSCGAAQEVVATEKCVPMAEESISLVPGWSLDGVSGSIDPESDVMTLSITGNRVAGPRVVFRGGKTMDPHTNPLFPRAFPIGTDDNSGQSFGSLDTTAIAGGVNSFVIHQR